MSRRPAKQRAVSGKAVGPIPFVCFSTASSASGLSYLTEPPDFSAISDANVTVSLKNLQKKDATTKAKALEELVSYVQSHPHDLDGGTEEPILDAWVGVECAGVFRPGRLVMYITGTTLSSRINRQCPARSRAFPRPAV